jgi:hypothetical protein
MMMELCQFWIVWMKIFQKYNPVTVIMKLGDNQESDCNTGISGTEQSDGQETLVVSG